MYAIRYAAAPPQTQRRDAASAAATSPPDNRAAINDVRHFASATDASKGEMRAVASRARYAMIASKQKGNRKSAIRRTPPPQEMFTRHADARRVRIARSEREKTKDARRGVLRGEQSEIRDAQERRAGVGR